MIVQGSFAPPKLLKMRGLWQSVMLHRCRGRKSILLSQWLTFWTFGDSIFSRENKPFKLFFFRVHWLNEVCFVFFCQGQLSIVRIFNQPFKSWTLRSSTVYLGLFVDLLVAPVKTYTPRSLTVSPWKKMAKENNPFLLGPIVYFQGRFAVKLRGSKP